MTHSVESVARRIGLRGAALEEFLSRLERDIPRAIWTLRRVQLWFGPETPRRWRAD